LGNVYVADTNNHRIQKFAVKNNHESSVPPVATFTSNVTEGYAPLDVQFTDISENATGWNWHFGDGTNAASQNPSHI
jgi:PKD repeat protein